MNDGNDLDAARKSLGPVGTYLPVPFTSAPPAAPQRAAAGRPAGARRLPRRPLRPGVPRYA